LNEVYQFSNAHVATAFAKALALFVSTLPAAPPDAGEMSIEGHAIPALTLPNPPVVPSLMTGGIFVRLILLAGIVGGAVAINTPEGKIYSSALWSRGMEIGSQAMAKFRSHPSEATTSIAVSPLPSPVPAPQPTTTVTATTSPQANAEPPVVTKKTKSSGLSVAATTPNGAAQDQGAAQVQTAPAIPSTKSNSADTNAIQSTSQPPTASEPEVSTAVPQPSKPVAAATAAPVTSAPPASTSLSSDQLARLQQKLIELGYLEGEPENRVTVKVIAAFNHWRRETGRSAVQTIGPDEYSVFMRAINR
jgi:hypothetical protein